MIKKALKIICLICFITGIINRSYADSPYLIKSDSSSVEVPFGDLFDKIFIPGLSYESFTYAYQGYLSICDSLHMPLRYLCIADFIKPSSEKRLYIIDMADSSLIHQDYVSHGRNSGTLYAESFSNIPSSLQSSLGFYLISESYQGKHGLSLRLDGLDQGFNDQARNRAVVMHAADYADPSFISLNGRLGRSQGCPALPYDGFQKVAPILKQSSILFIYFPQEEYLNQSVWLNRYTHKMISGTRP